MSGKKGANGALRNIQRVLPEVTSVMDAKKNISIHVEWNDVEEARMGDPENCAIAQACKRELRADHVLVSKSIAYIIKGNKATRYWVPTETQRQIAKFDAMESFEPAEYRLYTPYTSQRLGEGLHGGYNAGTKRRVSKLRRVIKNQRPRISTLRHA